MGTQTAHKFSLPIDKPNLLSVLICEGVALRQRGRDWWGLCPFPGHNEKTPSFKVSDHGFYCFGCNTGGGDSINLVMKMHGLSFKAALQHLGVEKKRTPAERKAAEADRLEREEKAQLVAAFRAWEQGTVNSIASTLRAHRHLKATRTTFSEAELIAQAELQGEIDILSYHYEILCRRDDKHKYELFKETQNYADERI